MDEEIVKRYLKKVEDTLEGLDTKEKASILFELESHIMEKSSEMAKEEGLKHPTKNIFEITIQELASMINQLCDNKSKMLHKPRVPDDPEQRRPDITKARKLLGWVPNTSLEQGLKKTIEWFKGVLKR